MSKFVERKRTRRKKGGRAGRGDIRGGEEEDEEK